MKVEEEGETREKSLLRGSVMELYSLSQLPLHHTHTHPTSSLTHPSHILSHTLTPHTPPHRVFPYLCRSVRNFARDRGGVSVSKEFYVAFEDVPTRHKYVGDDTTTQLTSCTTSPIQP